MSKLLLFLMVCPLTAYPQYQQLSKISGKNTTIVTQWTDGYVQKATGERLEGKIQLKVVNNDTVEIRYKNSSKVKSEFPRAQVKAFGRMIDPNAHHSNNPRFNFQSGFVILTNGTKLEGKVRTNNLEPNGKQTTLPDIIEYVDAANNLRLFNAWQAQGCTFTIDGVEISYERYKENFLEQLAKGKLNVLPNPNPTTEAVFATNLSRAIDSAITKSPSNTMVYRNEYLVRRENSGDYAVVTPVNYEEWSKQTMATCSEFNLLDPKSRKELTHWSKFMDFIKFFNEKCR